jgi:hypothetical protein
VPTQILSSHTSFSHTHSTECASVISVTFIYRCVLTQLHTTLCYVIVPAWAGVRSHECIRAYHECIRVRRHECIRVSTSVSSYYYIYSIAYYYIYSIAYYYIYSIAYYYIYSSVHFTVPQVGRCLLSRAHPYLQVCPRTIISPLLYIFFFTVPRVGRCLLSRAHRLFRACLYTLSDLQTT